MFAAHVNMGAANAQLEARPIPFDRIGMVNAVNPLVGAVVDRAVFVAEVGDLAVGTEFVATEPRSR